MTTTKVIFRKFKSGVAKGEIIALFPYDMWNYGECASYMHVGQHSGADYNAVMMSTKPAKPEEYQELYNELVEMVMLISKWFKKEPQRVLRRLLTNMTNTLNH